MISEKEIEAIAKGMAPIIKEYVRAAVNPLERELVELKSKGVRFMGVHQRAVSYRLGSLVTFDGALFAAVRDVAEGEVPKSSDGWQLCVKAGRDGKDLR